MFQRRSLPQQTVVKTPHITQDHRRMIIAPSSGTYQGIKSSVDQMRLPSHAINIGLGQRSNDTVRHSYSLAVFREGHETGLFEHAPVFAHRPASLSTQHADTICVLSVPHLNFHLEDAARQQAASSFLSFAAGPSPVDSSSSNIDDVYRQLNRTQTYSKQFQLHNPIEFAQQYSFLGALETAPLLRRKGSSASYATATPQATIQTAGLVTMKQQFAQSVSSGDQLYWIVKPMETPYKQFLSPSGAAAGSRTAAGTSFLQLMGFSDKDSVVPVPSSASGDRDIPRQKDSMGVAKNIALHGHYSLMEYDEASDSFLKRDTEDADVPDLIVDLWQQGHVIPVGTVQSADPKKVSEEDLLLSYRDYNKQKLLPNVQVVKA